ncbi:MAG: DUF92 domain-containing protein [Candidatus Micrarchaeia archaeon]
MVRALLLDLPGTISAAIIGGLIIVFGGPNALPFFLLILTVLLSGVLVTKFDYDRKRQLAVYEHERSWANVLANGGVPALVVIASALFSFPARAAYVGSLAAVSADKFASELGVLGGRPLALWSMKRVRPGTSGAVSLLGLLASIDGGALIGLTAWLLYPGTYSFVDVALIAGVGFIGSLFDTLLGVLEERGIGNKQTTNLLCALAGALAGALLLH